MFRCCHQEGGFDLWCEQPVRVRHTELGLKVGAGTEATNDQGRPRVGSNTNGEIRCREDLHSCARSAELSINHASQESGALIKREECLFVRVRQDCNHKPIGNGEATANQVDVTKRHRIKTARVERHSFTHCQPPITLPRCVPRDLRSYRRRSAFAHIVVLQGALGEGCPVACAR